MSDSHGSRDDRVLETLGRIDGTMGGLVRDVAELRSNAVTKEVLEAKIDPIKRFVYGLMALVLVTVGVAILNGVINRPAPPRVQINIPTAVPVRSP